MRPSRTRTRSMPVTDTRRPVGAKPSRSPSCVPSIVVATAARSPSATTSSTRTVTSGNAVRNVSKKRRTPAMPDGKPGGMLWETTSGAKKRSSVARSPEAKSSACRRSTSSRASIPRSVGCAAMRILVTGSRGKVGSATVDALHAAGHEVTACDLGPPVFESVPPRAPSYKQADLTDAGEAYAVVRGHDAVIHAAAIPEPTRNAPHVVFHNNLMGVFNTLEAAIRFGVPRFVNVSSETAPGFFFPERPCVAAYAPVDEQPPIRPQEPSATAKYFSELLMDAAMRRSDIRCLTIRPSWVQWEGNYAHNLGPSLRDPEAQASPA